MLLIWFEILKLCLNFEIDIMGFCFILMVVLLFLEVFGGFVFCFGINFFCIFRDDDNILSFLLFNFFVLRYLFRVWIKINFFLFLGGIVMFSLL